MNASNVPVSVNWGVRGDELNGEWRAIKPIKARRASPSLLSVNWAAVLPDVAFFSQYTGVFLSFSVAILMFWTKSRRKMGIKKECNDK
jgi:hypothetical protein